MSLLQKFDDDLKIAIKTSDKLKVSVLRMAKAALKNRQIEKRAELSEDEVLSVISMLSKQRRESIEQFSKGGRDDLSEKERQELAILQSYLPNQLSPEEL
ncbi:MAG: GatB/YqeY domain-containing protein, partial [Nitrospirota bacterium]|nr:GatB/YqeY domain-containing protein [Nitrospirota bacterium]